MASEQTNESNPGLIGRFLQAVLKKGTRMSVRQVDENYFVAGQIRPENIEVLVRNGFSTVICIRPDGEGFGQTPFAEIESVAKASGLDAYYLPVGGGLPAEHISQMKSIMANAKGKVLGYCASGSRATVLYQMAR